MTDFNIQNQMATQFGNTSAANSFLGNQLGMQNQDWLAQLQAISGLQQSGLGGQLGVNQSYANNFQVPQGNGFGSLAGALGNIYGSSQGSQYGTGSQNPYLYGAGNYGTNPDGTAAG